MGVYPNPDTRFKPGPDWKGNAKGRPKGSILTHRLRKIVRQRELRGEPMPEGMTVADQLMTVLCELAISGDVRAMENILNRIDGKVPDKLEHDGGTAIRVVYDDDRPDGQPAPAASGPTQDPAALEAVQRALVRPAVREDETGDLPAGPAGP